MVCFYHLKMTFWAEHDIPNCHSYGFVHKCEHVRRIENLFQLLKSVVQDVCYEESKRPSKG